MKIFSIDNDKCVKCGVCAEVCPLKIIRFMKDEAPVQFPWAPKVCINCGHCVAVCPKGAFSLNTMPVAECKTIKNELNVTADAIEQFFCSRRSIRTYKGTPVDKQIIERVISISRYAPTGHNKQNVNWRVVYDTKEVNRYKDLVIRWMEKMVAISAPISEVLGLARVIAGCEHGEDLIFRRAPHLIITHGLKSDRMAHLSCSIALTHFELVCRAFGLGGCWAGFFDIAASMDPDIQKELGLPEGHVSCSSMMVGESKYKYHRIPLRNIPPITWK
ncbi:MAG TPA: nitroreductase family protein [Candidatus Omnitrophota bacterium]|nr:nitroreductase family protein [Candidatus Omnitrophota bacterium]HPS20610.1 nitroreductase family protein [Candidatus Omnitrophota bacterium]